jgi:multiple sugar transport system substrate-binding protein
LNRFNKIIKGSNILIAVLFILLVLLIFAFFYFPQNISSSEDEKVTKIYYADNISPAHKVLIDRFNHQFSGEIEVVPVNLPFSKFSTNERKELLARTLRSKSDKIDLFTVDIIWVPRFAKWSQPLDQYFSNKFRDQIVDHVLESSYFDDHFVSIPHYTDIGIMYYRKDLIRMLPNSAEIEQKLKGSISWEEIIQIEKQFRKIGFDNPIYIFPANNYEGLICSFYEGLAGQNTSFFEDGILQLNTPQARKSLQLLVDLTNKYNITPHDVTRFDEFLGYLFALQNDAVFVRGWPGFLEHYNDIFPDTSDFRFLEKAALPHFEDGKPAFVYGGWNFMVSKFSQNQDATIKFIQFALNRKNQELLFETGGYIPVNKSVYEDSIFLAKYPDLTYYHSLLKNGVHRPFIENYTKISDVISYYVHLAIKNEITVDEALAQSTELINSEKVLIK